jgi:hypothetical protein
MRSSKIMRKAQSAKIERSEDGGTARIVRKAKPAVATGREIPLPKTIMDRLAASKNPLVSSERGKGKS